MCGLALTPAGTYTCATPSMNGFCRRQIRRQMAVSALLLVVGQVETLVSPLPANPPRCGCARPLLDSASGARTGMLPESRMVSTG